MAKRTRQYADIAQLFRVLSDETRLRIIDQLQGGDCNVTTLVKKLKVAQPTVSHHLAIMRMAGVVDARRSGKAVFYSLAADPVQGQKALAAMLSAEGMRIGGVVFGMSKGAKKS